MRNLKSVFGVMGALVPILYCGGLLYYFFDLSGSVHEVWTDGLGPTVLGLGVVALVFCIPLIIKLVRIFSGPRSPGSGGRGGSDQSADDDARGFDADAAIARYMAQRSVEAVPNTPAVPPTSGGGVAAKRPGFGRRGG